MQFCNMQCKNNLYDYDFQIKMASLNLDRVIKIQDDYQGLK